jgi:hypothetical protein
MPVCAQSCSLPDMGAHVRAQQAALPVVGQPAIFGIVEVSKKWYDLLPADLQQIVDNDAASESMAIYPQTIEINDRARKALD